jgi:hypothetical protein
MAGGSHQQIVKALRATIEQLERDPETRPEDPALDVLKRLLVRRLATIEVEEEAEPDVSLEPAASLALEPPLPETSE